MHLSTSSRVATPLPTLDMHTVYNMHRSQPKLRNGLAPKIPAWALVWPHPVTQRIWNLQPKGFLAKLFAATTGNWKPPFFGIVRFLGGLGNSLGDLVKRRAPYVLACSVSMVHCRRALELVCQYVSHVHACQGLNTSIGLFPYEICSRVSSLPAE